MALSVSVVTPSYNQAPFIRRTIESVLTQDVPVEYVVIDGASTDGTVDVLREYEDRLRWVSEPDRGQADAVNKGLHATTGEVIGWLNSDDVYYRGAARAAVEFFAAHPTVDVVYGDANHIDADDAVIEPYYTEPWDLARFIEVCFISQPAAFFRRRALRRYGLLVPRLRYCMDYEFWLRIALRGGQLVHLPRVLAGSRLYAETKTLGARVAVHAEICTMLRVRLGRVPDRWLFNYAHAVVEARGMRRDHPVRFSTLVALESLRAAARWNGRPTRAMLRTTTRWIAGSTRIALQEKLAG